jgi:curved DNA-binding protein CbpA
VKSHYDLIGVDPGADAETIKKAFRRAITQYHPDKVTHLAMEFQELASIRAAELTTAYKILTNPDSRAEYDEALIGSTADPVAPTPPPAWPAAAAVAPESEQEYFGGAATSRVDEDLAGKNDIVRRATLQRVHLALSQAVGDCDFPAVRGFDLACIPRAKAVTSLSDLLKKPVAPIVLVRVVSIVDGAAAMEAFGNAVRSRIDSKGRPIAILLIGNQLGPAGELARAVEDARIKSPVTQDRIFPVLINTRDWSGKIPLNTPDSIRTLVQYLRQSG